MSEPVFVAETLAWCNERRADDGKPPLARLPKGKRIDPASCPCGKATGLCVTASYARLHRERWFGLIVTRKLMDVPPAVSRFVHAFDRGELPQYEEKR